MIGTTGLGWSPLMCTYVGWSRANDLMMWLVGGSAWMETKIGQKSKIIGRGNDEDGNDDSMDHRR